MTLMVDHRTEVVDALCAYLYEFGYIAPQGIGHPRSLTEVVENENTELPDLVREICRGLLEHIAQTTARELVKQIRT
ncbi:hypothetical protein [Bradyrhizobium sp. B117]|uniref:hypothetical protein n=1 Tax=Bradyrhizobium sp. B117 TaxID=3140246 RepID=UPI003183D362